MMSQQATPTQASLLGQPGSADALERQAGALAQLAALRAGERVSGALDFHGLRLIGEDLSGLELTRADFSGADLSRANLQGARLLGAKLAGASLFEARLEGAELSGADLRGANLAGADLTRAGLGLANLEQATLRGASLGGATLSEAKLRGADLSAADLAGARLRGADLRTADLTRCNLRGADLQDSLVEGACFAMADLRESNLCALQGFERAHWIGVDLREIDFTGAYLARAFIMDQNFIEEFRTRSRWNSLVYQVWRFTSDCGRSATRWALCTTAIVLLFAGIYTRVGIDYGAHPTALSPLYFSVVTMTTLGYGDVLPTSMGGQVAAMCQVVTGYVLLGGLLSIFSNKMASRAR